MNLPGFQASASLCASTNVYWAGASQHAGGAITPAQNSCTCTSPQCTWSCPTGPNCPPGFTDCGGACKDLNFDFYNCGSCGHRCPENETCDEGKCVCIGNFHLCDGKCISKKYRCN
jgi:hypothetical protein